jgi:hypothetical protein
MLNWHLMKETERIVFFDIDSTLTSSVDHYTLVNQPSYMAYKKSIFNQNWKTIGLYDFMELSQSSIALFACFLRQTGAKAVCISSWNTERYNGIFLKELKEAFEAVSDFPENWFLGCAGGSGGDRYTYTIIPFLSETEFNGDYIAIDDGAFEYKEQKRTIGVDGKIGFNIHDYEKGLALFDIKEKPNLEWTA